MMMKAPNSTATALPLHQNRDSKVSGYPGFIHWVQLDRPGEIDGNRPSQDCVSLASLPDSEAHPTLLFYTYGPTSEQIAAILRQTPADEVSARLMDYFRPYYSLLPSFDATDPDCEPAAVLASGWANDEFAGYGSYSNFQTGLEDGDKDLEAMRMGMPERCIWLAGEHTAPFIASGTVTGAYWSGEDVAKRILASCNVDTSLERPESSPKPSLTD